MDYEAEKDKVIDEYRKTKRQIREAVQALESQEKIEFAEMVKKLDEIDKSQKKNYFFAVFD